MIICGDRRCYGHTVINSSFTQEPLFVHSVNLSSCCLWTARRDPSEPLIMYSLNRSSYTQWTAHRVFIQPLIMHSVNRLSCTQWTAHCVISEPLRFLGWELPTKFICNSRNFSILIAKSGYQTRLGMMRSKKHDDTAPFTCIPMITILKIAIENWFHLLLCRDTDNETRIENKVITW